MELDDRELKRLKELVPYKVLAPTPDEICEEIERLHSIIKESRKETEKQLKGAICQEFTDLKAILRILDKENK